MADDARCWLCERPLGRRVERHHPIPRSRGGRETVAVHPICHRMIHICYSNAELMRLHQADKQPREVPRMQRFLTWIAGKPPDFNAVSRRGGK